MSDDEKNETQRKQTLEEWLKLGNTIERLDGRYYEQVKKPIRMRGCSINEGSGKIGN